MLRGLSYPRILSAAAATAGLLFAKTCCVVEREGRQLSEAATSDQALRNPRELDACKTLGLPTPREASASTKVIVIKHLFSDDEIDQLVAVAKGLQRKHLVGDVKRDKHGEAVSVATDMVWQTSYLHTNGEFARRLPEIRKKILLAFSSVDDEHFHLISTRRKSTGGGERSEDSDNINLRTVEFHEYWPGGQLNSDLHYDAGSLITMDIMLTNPGEDFCGGQLVTPYVFPIEKESCERESGKKVFFPVENFRKGDAAFFLSHKYHNVLPVRRGKRTVLVVEVWEGPEKSCPHRCLTSGPCKYSLARAHIDSYRQHLAILG